MKKLKKLKKAYINRQDTIEAYSKCSDECDRMCSGIGSPSSINYQAQYAHLGGK